MSSEFLILVSQNRHRKDGRKEGKKEGRKEGREGKGREGGQIKVI